MYVVCCLCLSISTDNPSLNGNFIIFNKNLLLHSIVSSGLQYSTSPMTIYVIFYYFGFFFSFIFFYLIFLRFARLFVHVCLLSLIISFQMFVYTNEWMTDCMECVACLLLSTWCGALCCVLSGSEPQHRVNYNSNV